MNCLPVNFSHPKMLGEWLYIDKFQNAMCIFEHKKLFTFVYWSLYLPTPQKPEDIGSAIFGIEYHKLRRELALIKEINSNFLEGEALRIPLSA